MSKGFCIQDGNPRSLTYEGSVVAVGGSSREGLHANGRDLIFDGKVIASSSYVPKVGAIIKNDEVLYGDDVLRMYPQGVTEVGSMVPNAWYYYPEGWVCPQGAKQGAAIYGGKWYQFYAGGHVNVLNLVTGRVDTSFNIPWQLWPADPEDELYHCSSAQFSNEFVNPNDELPLLYITESSSITHIGYTCVFNLNTNPISLVRWWKFGTGYYWVGDYRPPHPAVAAYDFVNGIAYSVGYPQGVGTGVTNHKDGGRFEVIPYLFPRSGSGDLSSQVTLDLERKVILNKTQNVTYINSEDFAEGLDRDWSNLQDADFKDGHVYVLYGGGNNDRPKIIDYIPMSPSANAMYTNICRVDDSGLEGEGIGKWKNGWVVSALYNPEKIFVL